MAIRLQPRSWTTGRRYFPTRIAASQLLSESAKSGFSPVQVIPTGSQSVPSAGTFDFQYQGDLDANLIIIDIPNQIDCTIYLNGAPIVNVTDRQGLDIAIPLGTEDGRITTKVQSVRAQGTSFSGDLRDVRVWVVGVT